MVSFKYGLQTPTSKMDVGEEPTMLKETYHDGLKIWYESGNPGRRKDIGIVIGRGLGVPQNIEDERWAMMFHELGYPVAFSHYTGTWANKDKGDFLQITDDGASPDGDVSTTIDFLVGEEGVSEVGLVGNCFGATPVLVAGSRDPRVSKIATVGGMIYTDEEGLNHNYMEMDENIYRIRALQQALELIGENGVLRSQIQERVDEIESDYFLMLGREHLTEYGGNAYRGFDFDRWKRVVMGQTGHNAYKHAAGLLEKDYLGIHAYADSLVSYKRTKIFGDVLLKMKKLSQCGGEVRTEILKPRSFGSMAGMLGHRNIEEADGFHELLFRFFDKYESSERIAEARRNGFSRHKKKVNDFMDRKGYMAHAPSSPRIRRLEAFRT